MCNRLIHLKSVSQLVGHWLKHLAITSHFLSLTAFFIFLNFKKFYQKSEPRFSQFTTISTIPSEKDVCKLLSLQEKPQFSQTLEQLKTFLTNFPPFRDKN